MKRRFNFLLIVTLAMGFASLSIPVSAQSDADEGSSATEKKAVNNYETATAAGQNAEAAWMLLGSAKICRR